MKTWKLGCVGFLLSVALAAPTQAAGWFTADSINRIQAQDNGAIIPVVNNSVNHECGSKTLQIYSATALGVDRILAILLTNQVAGRRMQFYITHCSGTIAIFDRVEDY